MTGYLLDTAVFLWNSGETRRLGTQVRKILSNPNASVFVSAVTSWEIATKYASGKLRLPEPAREFTRKRLAITGFLPLAITHEHALASGELPELHKDPFDRILIAQAQTEGLVLITGDEQITKYSAATLWAAK